MPPLYRMYCECQSCAGKRRAEIVFCSILTGFVGWWQGEVTMGQVTDWLESYQRLAGRDIDAFIEMLGCRVKGVTPQVTNHQCTTAHPNYRTPPTPTIAHHPHTL